MKFQVSSDASEKFLVAADLKSIQKTDSRFCLRPPNFNGDYLAIRGD